MDLGVIDLSRLQFALTALYHFLFVPLTLGLSMMLVIMESVYVMTNRPVWRGRSSRFRPVPPRSCPGQCSSLCPAAFAVSSSCSRRAGAPARLKTPR